MDRRPLLKYFLLWLIGALIWGRFFFVLMMGMGEISEFADMWRYYPQFYLLAWVGLQAVLTALYVKTVRSLSGLSWEEIARRDVPVAIMPVLLIFWSIPDEAVFMDAGLIAAGFVFGFQLLWRWTSIYYQLVRQDKSKAGDFAYLSLMIGLGLVVRLWLLATSHSVAGSEEAIMGLMARHLMTTGEFSVFLWGQPYMGSLEAIIAVPYFFLLGASSLTLKMVPLTFSLIFIAIVFAIGKKTGGVVAGRIAALIVSISPVFLVFISLFATAYMENLVFSGLIILALIAFLEKEEAPVWLWLWIGFLCGLSFWNNINSVYVIIPAVFVLLYRGMRGKRVMALAMSAAFAVLGALPLVLFNLRHGGRTFVFLLSGTGGDDAILSRVSQNLTGLFGVSQAIFGFGIAGEPLAALVLVFYLASFAYGLYLIINKENNPYIKRSAIILLYAVLGVFVAMYALTRYGSLNEARYAIILYLIYPVLFGAALARVGKYSKTMVLAVLVMAVFVNMAGVSVEAKKQPPQTARLAEMLEAIGVDRIYTGFWTAYQLTFVSKEKIICAGTDLNVYKSYYDIVEKSDLDRKGILFDEGSKEEGEFIKEITNLGVSYKRSKLFAHILYYDFQRFPDMSLLTLPK